MSGLDPTGPSQPSLQQAYETPGNAASKDPSEQQATRANAQDDSEAVDQRIPREQSNISEATPSSLGRGIRGSGPGEESKGLTDSDVGRHNELDGEQMAAPGEGRVADAVAGRGGDGGVGGEQEDFASDLDRKKEEQREARERIKGQRAQGMDVGGSLGQSGGPANPVDRDGYPNSGS